MSQRNYLYQLQRIDSEIDRIKKRINQINDTINNDQDVLTAKKKLESSNAIYERAKKSLNEVECEVKKNRDKINQSESRLYSGNVKNPKELQDIQTEIQSIKNRIADLENTQLEAMMELEDAEAIQTQSDKRLSSLLNAKESENRTLLDEKSKLEEKLEQQNNLRSPLLPMIESEYLDKYNKLRKTKNGLAVATIDAESCCSACGSSLTSSIIQSAKSQMPDCFCTVCRRFLFSG